MSVYVSPNGISIQESQTQQFVAPNGGLISTIVTTGGQIKVWNGTSWVLKSVKVWNGTSWIVKPVKRWNGSAWVLT